jgi:hypothetical protein
LRLKISLTQRASAALEEKRHGNELPQKGKNQCSKVAPDERTGSQGTRRPGRPLLGFLLLLQLLKLAPLIFDFLLLLLNLTLSLLILDLLILDLVAD